MSEKSHKNIDWWAVALSQACCGQLARWFNTRKWEWRYSLTLLAKTFKNNNLEEVTLAITRILFFCAYCPLWSFLLINLNIFPVIADFFVLINTPFIQLSYIFTISKKTDHVFFIHLSFSDFIKLNHKYGSFKTHFDIPVFVLYYSLQIL